MNRISTLDGWRGVAILLVLFGHFSPLAWPIARGAGQHGVAIFFVLSGFLITTLLMQEKSLSGTTSLRGFYRRRFFRIMPAAWCYLAVMVAVTEAKPFSWKEIAGCVFVFRNFLFLDNTHVVTMHFWSLSIEEQFYLVWPVVLLLPNRVCLWIAVAGASGIASYRIVAWSALAHGTTAHSLMTQYRADALFVGCILALTTETLRMWARPWMLWPTLAGFAACVVANPPVVPLYESVLAGMAMFITSQTISGADRVLNLKPLVYFGTISYSLYLWQNPFWLIARDKGPWAMLFALPLTVAAAAASYYCVERPAIAFGRRLMSLIEGRELQDEMQMVAVPSVENLSIK